MADATVTTSVIIPVYNDPEGLRTTVESLLDQTVDDYEIIIADNGSTDGTRTLAAEYARENERVIHVVEDEIQGSYAARNAGIAVAEGNILCFIDADMWVESDWLENVQRRIRNNNTDYMGCNVEVVMENETMFAAYSQQKEFPIKEYLIENNAVPTCCLVVQRHVIDDVGMFDSRLTSGGDGEFGRRVAQEGYSQSIADNITMYHPARSTLDSILKKRYRVGRGSVQRSQYHPEMFTLERHPIHPYNFLPIRPTAVTSSIAQDTFENYIISYIFLYLLKLASTAGAAHEWLRMILVVPQS